MRLGVLIMAAGASRRFGGCKLLAEVEGLPLLQHTLNQAVALAPAELRVVTGRWHQDISEARQQARLAAVPLLFNPHWEQGLGSSIAFGVGHLAAKCDGILILLADQLGVKAVDLQRLLARFSGQQIACACYAGKRGVPALFAADLFDRLMALEGDRGAKALLHDAAYRVAELDLPQACFDIDTPEDLSNARAIHDPLHTHIGVG